MALLNNPPPGNTWIPYGRSSCPIHLSACGLGKQQMAKAFGPCTCMEDPE